MQKLNRIDAAIKRLNEIDPWYGLTLRHFERIADASFPTIGVRSDGTGENLRLQLIYNPHFVDEVLDPGAAGHDNRELMEVLRHEVLHPVFGHLRKETSGKRWNISQDCAINSLLNQDVLVPLAARVGACLPGQGAFKDVPAGKSADWYFANLPEGEGEGEGEGTLDVHLPLSPEAQEKQQRILKHVTDYVSQMNQWGNISSEMRERINNYLGGYDWRQELAQIVSRTRDTDVFSTRRKLNRRLPHAAGVIRKRMPRILVAIDESGSVSQELWTMLAGALSSLSLQAEFALLPFDCEVAVPRLQKFKKGKTALFHRSLAGGTDFSAPTAFFNEHSKDYDALFIATDGEAAAPIECDKKRVWVLPEKHRLAFSTGERVVYVR